MFGIEGNAFAAIALFGYIPFAFILFIFLPPRKAVIWDFIIAWLFLPMSHLPLHGFTDLNKMSAACIGTVAAALVFDNETVLSFRFRAWDIPMAIWCLCPFVSSFANDKGVYDAFSAIAYQITRWGLPYFIGRIYFSDLKGLRELAIAIIAGGIIYLPLVWFEIRMSPQLHRIVYGYHQHDFSQTERYGGYRPMVFMQHGLAVAMWMCTAALTAFWFWYTKAIDKVLGIPIGWVCILLMVTSLWLRSVGAEMLMIIGLGVLLLTSSTKSSVWVILITLVAPAWMFTRTFNLWDSSTVVHFAESYDARSAESLAVRFHSERAIVGHAMEKPMFGWTPWDFLPDNVPTWERIIPDQMWVIAIGQFGLVGITSVTVGMLLPIWLVMRRIPVEYWKTPAAAPVATLSMLLALHMCDNLFNAMLNPIFIIAAGGLTVLNFSFQSQPATSLARSPSLPITRPTPA